ncbi:MAG: glycosyltransferase family 1 protein [Planctomycetota bacterium]
MRIGLNGTAFDEMASGARDRFLNLYGEAARLGIDHTFVLYSPREFDLAPEFPGPLEAHFKTPLSPRSAFKRYFESRKWFARRLAKDGIDLFVTDHFPVIRGLTYGTLLTVHDLRYLVLPGEGSFARRWYFRRRFGKDVRRAKTVVTVSEAIRGEIREHLGLPEDRVFVVPNGVDAGFRAAESKRSYLLSVGVFERRKNLGLLLEMLAADPKLPDLVLSGRGGPEDKRLRSTAKRLGVADRVDFRGYVPEDDLPALYAGAAALVMPSLYEGFGLPLLQAFATDTPVVCSATPALKEVAGNAAALLSPDDPAAWGTAVNRVLTDEGLRAKMIGAGRKRAEKYTWTAAAERFLEIVASYTKMEFEETTELGE